MEQQSSSSRQIEGADVPTMLYGTAWKEEATVELTKMALEAGFFGIDSANHRKHYAEAQVGAAVQAYLRESSTERRALFLQSKFTYMRAQEHRLPYDADAALSTQVEQSFASSLEHFHTDYLDSFVIHGPAYGRGWADADREVWQAMEKLHSQGQVRFLGVSNVQAEQLELLLAEATVKPTFVQNRCYASQGWDRPVRTLCQQEQMVYQGFSLLTANGAVWAHPWVQRCAQGYQLTAAQLCFAFAQQVGMLPLTGTSSREHMMADLAALGVKLSDADVASLEALSFS